MMPDRSTNPPKKLREPRLLVVGLCLMMAGWAATAGAVPKTDVLTLSNGDVLTCEIKEMSRGQLQASTDDLGTVSIKWDKISRVVSHYWFLISIKEGKLIYGQMSESNKDGFLTVNFQEKTTTVPMSDVVEIQPVRYEFWDRVTMSASFGFNYSQGSDVLQTNAAASMKYQGPIYTWGFSGYLMITDQGESGGVTRRDQIDLTLGREISGRFNGNTTAEAYRNDELGIRMRVSGGLNVGYYLLRKSHLELETSLGANVNREWATADSDPTNNAEGDIGLAYSMYYYDSPKTNLTLSADYYPSFTISGRHRFEGNIVGKQEIIKNLYLALNYYESRDNKPPAGANATSDRGVVISIEWSKN